MRTITDIIKICVFTVFSFVLAGCSEFFEEDISDKEITLLSPGEGIETEIATQTFWWEKLENTQDYRLQIVSPSFEDAENVIADTLVSGDKYKITLYPGSYEWRVRGENNAYVSKWKSRHLTIIDTDDLTKQTVLLRNPANNLFTNSPDINFSWDGVFNAASYEFKIFTDGWNVTAHTGKTGLADNAINLDMEEGEFWWGARAVNESSQTLYSHSRFVIDRMPPDKPVLLSPQDKDNVDNAAVAFSWDSNDPVWQKVIDTLYIYEGNEVLYHKEEFDEKNAVVQLESGKTYTWKVISVDLAGNESEPSSVYEFRVR